MDVNDLLSRLQRVRKTGADRWIACCPAHDDRSPSLTVRQVEDGRILVHCFSGCGAADVVESVGLSLGDLFPAPLGQRMQPIRQPFSASDVLRALRREAGVVAISVADLHDGRPVDRQRVALAAERIADAAEYIHASA